MKQNRSLAISSKINECKTGNIIGMLENEFPKSILNTNNDNIKSEGEKKTRNRVFTGKAAVIDHPTPL